MTELSKRQLAALQRVWHDVQTEPDARETPDTDDSVCRAGLDAWLAGVISSDGRLTKTSLHDLIELEHEAEGHPVARAYVDRVVAVLMPHRDDEPSWDATLGEVIREHCRERNYQVSAGMKDRFGYQTWEIHVPNREGPVELSLNGEVFLLTFPGGFTWPDFAQDPEDASEAVHDQLRLLDAYADPATRTLSVKRALRRPRTELHLSVAPCFGVAEADDP